MVIQCQTGDNDCNVNSSHYSLSTALCESNSLSGQVWTKCPTIHDTQGAPQDVEIHQLDTQLSAFPTRLSEIRASTVKDAAPSTVIETVLEGCPTVRNELPRTFNVWPLEVQGRIGCSRWPAAERKRHRDPQKLKHTWRGSTVMMISQFNGTSTPKGSYSAKQV